MIFKPDSNDFTNTRVGKLDYTDKAVAIAVTIAILPQPFVLAGMPIDIVSVSTYKHA